MSIKRFILVFPALIAFPCMVAAQDQPKKTIDSGTGPCSWISSGDEWSICFRCDRPRALPSGFACILEWK
jgi:hypothetical protein